MSDLISRDLLKTRLANSTVLFANYDEWEHCCEVIDSVPTADVRENIHGEWIKWEAENGIDIGCECSNCHYKSSALPDYGTKFCPNCGARMDKHS